MKIPERAIIPGVLVSISIAILTYFYSKRKKLTPPKKWKSVGKLKSINIYPLKSGKKIELSSAECTDFGLQQSLENGFELHDRSFAVYRENNFECKTATTFPKLLFIEVAVNDRCVVFNAPGMESLIIDMEGIRNNTDKKDILLYNGPVKGFDCGDAAAKWISNYIYEKVSGLRICYHDCTEENRRDIVSSEDKNMFTSYKNLGNQSVGLYTNLTSILLMSQPTVDELNSLIEGDKVTADYFRPNFLVKDSFGDLKPGSEYHWEWVKIGTCIFRYVKLCTRCAMVTMNPETGLRNKNMEPLKTLKKYHRVKDFRPTHFKNDEPVMGIQLEVIQKGVINVNDTVFVN